KGKETKAKKIIPKRDTTNDLDWFKSYPITTTMQQHNKLNTPLAQQLFTLLKSNLRDFIPGQIIPKKTDNNKPNNRPLAKFSFTYILNKMAGDKPKFLTDFVIKSSPDFDQTKPIPFKALHDTLKGLLSKFTTVFFTQLDYLHILHSHYSIPPYSYTNRCRVAINIARLHLYLNHKYRTINFADFMKNLTLNHYDSHSILISNTAPSNLNLQ